MSVSFHSMVVTVRRLYVRLVAGLDPALRRSRFHTQKGDFALRSPGDGRDCLVALATSLARKALGVRPALPWVTWPAIRFIARRLSGCSTVFEWGAGMSTLWFERRCGEVHSVEDDPVWVDRITRRARKANIYSLEGEAYVRKICDFPAGYFDLISIDGSHRLACFRLAVERVKPGGMLLLDNTDNDRTTGGDLFVIDQELVRLGDAWEVRRFPGWCPCNLSAGETSVCVKC